MKAKAKRFIKVGMPVILVIGAVLFTVFSFGVIRTYISEGKRERVKYDKKFAERDTIDQKAVKQMQMEKVFDVGAFISGPPIKESVRTNDFLQIVALMTFIAIDGYQIAVPNAVETYESGAILKLRGRMDLYFKKYNNPDLTEVSRKSYLDWLIYFKAATDTKSLWLKDNHYNKISPKDGDWFKDLRNKIDSAKNILETEWYYNGQMTSVSYGGSTKKVKLYVPKDKKTSVPKFVAALSGIIDLAIEKGRTVLILYYLGA